MEHNLSNRSWTIASYLRSAASKFEEIAKDLRTLPGQAEFISSLDAQAAEAIKFAEIFESAETVTVDTEAHAN